MKKSKDPFEIAFEEQDESPPESPVGLDENESQAAAGPSGGDPDMNANVNAVDTSTVAVGSVAVRTAGQNGKNKEDDDEEEEENMDVELGKLQPTGDPAKTAKMQEILSHFTEEQMSRYESFRRSGFQRPNMKRLLANITGSAKISVPMTIVVSGIAKMFVGELVETARGVMAERKDTGPIRPCHMREAYRRLTRRQDPEEISTQASPLKEPYFSHSPCQNSLHSFSKIPNVRVVKNVYDFA